MSIWSRPETFRNSATYCGIDSRTWTASSWLKAISPGLAIGPPACSWRSAARPSQNCARLRLELSTVGELIGPCCHLWPIEDVRLSEPPRLRLWHELHEMKPDFDRRGSKKSCRPSSTRAGLETVDRSIGWIGSSRVTDDAATGTAAASSASAKNLTLMGAS